MTQKEIDEALRYGVCVNTQNHLEECKECSEKQHTRFLKEIFNSKKGDKVYIPMWSGKQQVWILSKIENI